MKTITMAELSAKLGAYTGSSNAGRNVSKVKFENGYIIAHYASNVLARCNGEWYFFPAHDYSQTTNRVVKGLCGMDKQERLRALEDGTAIYVK